MDYPSNKRTATGGVQPPNTTGKKSVFNPVETKYEEKQKVSTSSKFKELFGTSDMKDMGRFILKEKAIPFLKVFAIDVVKHYFKMDGAGSSTFDTPSYTNYSKPQTSYSSGPTSYKQSNQNVRELGQIIFQNHQDATDILDYMDWLIEEHGYCTLAEIMSQCRQRPQWTDNDWGWYETKGAHIEEVRGQDNKPGYRIIISRPVALRKR